LTTFVASFPPPIDRNPYQALLYRHLADEGITVVAAPRLSVGWLRANRHRVTTLHFHWPENYYRFDRGWPRARHVFTWARLGLFGVRLAIARLLGYRIVWTVHQIHPHERSSSSLDVVAASMLAHLSDALIVLDRATGEALAREVAHAAGKIHVVRHGSYAGVYPAGRSRDEMRAALGIPGDAFVALGFGQIRKYKDLDLLLAGFRRAAIPGAVLLVAGLPLDEEDSRRLEKVAAQGRDVVAVMDFVPDEEVAELHEASDVAVSARGDGGTSGSLILALTLGTPVIAAATAGNRELTGDGRAGWHFVPGSVDSLGDTLRAASSDTRLRDDKARCAAQLAAATPWEEIARETARLLKRPR